MTQLEQTDIINETADAGAESAAGESAILKCTFSIIDSSTLIQSRHVEIKCVTRHCFESTVALN